MAALLDKRNAVIAAAEQMIEDANAEFDEVALELGRAINEARAALAPPKPERPKRTRTPRRRKDPNMEGLSERDKEMYRQLLTKKVSK